jgi:hypothetical protein
MADLQAAELYDSDVLAMEPVYRWAVEQQGKRLPLEDFRQKLTHKFYDHGFVVNVKAYTTTEEGVYAFDVEVLRKIEKKEFDYDKQVHQVVSNVLDLPDQAGGWIKADAGMKEAAKKAAEHKH